MWSSWKENWVFVINFHFILMKCLVDCHKHRVVLLFPGVSNHPKEHFFLAAFHPTVYLCSSLYSCQIIPHFMCQRLEHPVLFDSFSGALAQITLHRWRSEEWEEFLPVSGFWRTCTVVVWLALSPRGRKVVDPILIGLFLCRVCMFSPWSALIFFSFWTLWPSGSQTFPLVQRCSF